MVYRGRQNVFSALGLIDVCLTERGRGLAFYPADQRPPPRCSHHQRSSPSRNITLSYTTLAQIWIKSKEFCGKRGVGIHEL